MYRNLEAEMAREGVTQSDIAEFLGKSQSTISFWMRGKSGEFPVGAAIRLKNEFFKGCSVEYLFKPDVA